MFNITAFPSHCGSRIFHNLEMGVTKAHLEECFETHQYKTAFAIYTDTPQRHKTYKKLVKLYKILYQSPVLTNPSTENKYFIVIYLNEKP